MKVLNLVFLEKSEFEQQAENGELFSWTLSGENISLVVEMKSFNIDVGQN